MQICGQVQSNFCKAIGSKQCELQHTTHPDAVDVWQGIARPVSLKQLVHDPAGLTGTFTRHLICLCKICIAYCSKVTHDDVVTSIFLRSALSDHFSPL